MTDIEELHEAMEIDHQAERDYRRAHEILDEVRAGAEHSQEVIRWALRMTGDV